MNYELRDYGSGRWGYVCISEGGQSTDVPFHRQGMCLYLDLSHAYGQLTVTREIYAHLKELVSMEHDLGVSCNMASFVRRKQLGKFWDDLSLSYPPLRMLRSGLSYYLWVSFRPVRHWLRPLMQDSYY